jgi:prophage regulatory protein
MMRDHRANRHGIYCEACGETWPCETHRLRELVRNMSAASQLTIEREQQLVNQISLLKRQKQRPAEKPYLGRRDLLALVPLSMSSIDTMEKTGEFPSRFVLSPTVKVCWKRSEVIAFLDKMSKQRVHPVRRRRKKR